MALDLDQSIWQSSHSCAFGFSNFFKTLLSKHFAYNLIILPNIFYEFRVHKRISLLTFNIAYFICKHFFHYFVLYTWRVATVTRLIGNIFILEYSNFSYLTSCIFPWSIKLSLSLPACLFKLCNPIVRYKQFLHNFTKHCCISLQKGCPS